MSEASRGRVFSGIQPTGAIHVGNYFGAMQNFVELQERCQCIYCIVDYHAITMPYSVKEMRRLIIDAAVAYLAVGIDPEKSILFVQSDVPEHTELTWVLNTVTPFGSLRRMTQFKAKAKDQKELASVGLFDYPVLQAADILLYKASLVPVGKDQLQHLELSREIARKFNKLFGKTFPEPEPILSQAPKIMSLADPTQKMSKSQPGSYIGIFDSDEDIRRNIMRAVTDTGPTKAKRKGPGIANLFTLLQLAAAADVRSHFNDAYQQGSIKYSELKEALAESLIDVLRPIRARREALADDPKKVVEVLRDGAARLRPVAEATMSEVKEKMGLTL